MPRQRYKIHPGTENDAFFITCTTVQWLPLFTRAEYCEILINAWQHHRKASGLQIFSWVIMDNHVHAIVSSPNLPRVMQSWKSFTAKQLILKLQELGQSYLSDELIFLKNFHGRGRANEEAGNRLHQVWQNGYHPQVIDTDYLWEQKSGYIENNPVVRGLVASPEHWRFSSAHEWCQGARAVMKCDPWYPQAPVIES